MQDEDESRDKQKLHLTDKAEWQYSDREKENLEVISNKIIGKSIPLISGVLHTHVARQPDRVHVRQVRAERAVHDPAQPRQRRRPWADEQLLPRAWQQVGGWLLCPSHLIPRINYTFCEFVLTSIV